MNLLQDYDVLHDQTIYILETPCEDCGVRLRRAFKIKNGNPHKDEIIRGEARRFFPYCEACDKIQREAGQWTGDCK